MLIFDKKVISIIKRKKYMRYFKRITYISFIFLLYWVLVWRNVFITGDVLWAYNHHRWW